MTSQKLSKKERVFPYFSGKFQTIGKSLLSRHDIMTYLILIVLRDARIFKNSWR